MGCLISKKQESPSTSNSIRVVHMNGNVEDFDCPLTAGEITGKKPKHFLCTQAQLMIGGLKPLKPEAWLEPSQFYFLFSYSTIQSESSAIDIANTAKRLIKIAKTSQPLQANKLQGADISSNDSTRGNFESLSAITPNMLYKESKEAEFVKQHEPCKGGSWKPVLWTIKESSFSRKSELDLQEIMHLEITKII